MPRRQHEADLTAAFASFASAAPRRVADDASRDPHSPGRDFDAPRLEQAVKDEADSGNRSAVTLQRVEKEARKKRSQQLLDEPHMPRHRSTDAGMAEAKAVARTGRRSSGVTTARRPEGQCQRAL